MAKLSFLDQLNERQIEYAEKIATKAKEMGIPPSLAIAIAYHESRLNPDVARGKSGEFGIMQVMPDTGKGMGFTNKDLNDPDKNIEAGLKYLKQNLDAFGGDPKMATVGYNAGTNSPFFSGGELPKITEEYVKAMKGYGAYDEEAAPAPSGVEKAKQFLFGGSPPAAEETDAEREARMQSDMDAQEKRQAQMMGAAAGAGVSGTRLAGTGLGAALEAGATRVGQGFRAGMQGGVPTTPTTPTGPLQGGLSALDPNANQATRILQGTTGDEGTTGRARQQGYNEQTSQQAAQRKETEKLLAQLRQTGAVADDAPAFFARQPGMTSTPSGVVYPRSEPSPSLGPRGPQGQVGYSRPPAPPPPPPPSMYSKAISGLDAVTDMFKGLMRPVATAASTAGKYVLPPLALASAAGEGVNIAQQARRPEGQRDTTGMMLSGANIVGSGLSMFPGTAPVGVPLMLGATAAQAYRSNPDWMKQKMQGAANIPMLEEMTGPLP